mgnify:CR=1 FL=1
MNALRRWLPALLALQLAFAPGSQPLPRPASQSLSVTQLMARMTPAEKVGQLFLVTFYGASAEAGSDIERLITQYRVGGVALLAANDNITDTLDAPGQALGLINRLQTLAATAAEAGGAPEAEPAASAAPFIPLFIATNHDGDGYPYTEIRSGLTDLPSAMAIGATWDPLQAQAMGEIAGAELSALGVNLLLGPSLDVLEDPRPAVPGAPGTRAFGGDPFWVGRLGRSYIEGVHAGSDGRLAVAAKAFPGLGATDRNPVDEVPTVRKSLEELTQIDLVPFFMVTGGAPDPAATADALMSAHIRFQGFQGNIRQTTSPVSFDPRAFTQLLTLPELQTWRDAGGLMISDSLGTRAVKRFYDPTERDFNPRRIASEAFLAGNDVLYLSSFGQNPRADQLRNIADVITYFAQRYAEDRAFASRVDASVARILQLKLRLYNGQFSLERATRSADDLAVLGQGRGQVMELARRAATLISPSLEELAARAPEPPAAGERIVFLTDIQVGRQCAECPLNLLIDRQALEDAVLQLYGPAGSGQVNPRNVQSFGFDELAAYLNLRANPPATTPETPTPEPLPIESALNQADWIVLAMLDVNPAQPNSNLVSAFLSQRPDLVRAKRTIVFAFNAPYFLDTTDLSKLTAYYALYSKGPAFIDAAAQLLFGQLVPGGRPPLSVESIGYDLIQVTAPDPAQTVELFSDTPLGEVGTPVPAGTATPSLGLQVGDVLRLRTSVIRDRNGFPVPDGTPARFMLVYTTGESRDFSFIDTVTEAGMARADLTLDRLGFLEISISEPVVQRSSKLQIPVQPGVVFFVTQIVPPTDTPTITPSPTETPVPPTPTSAPTPANPGEIRPTPPTASAGDFIVMLFGLAGALVAGYRLGGSEAQPRRGVRLALLGAIGVLLGYNFFALGLPGIGALRAALGPLAALASVLAGGGVGLAAGWAWLRQAEPVNGAAARGK